LGVRVRVRVDELPSLVRVDELPSLMTGIAEY
jgi:hypothetical protein